MPINERKMANELKDVLQGLLIDLRGLSSKIDLVQRDITELKVNVAVLNENKKALDELFVCHDHLKEKVEAIDKQIAVSDTKKTVTSGIVASVVTVVTAVLIAWAVGAFNKPIVHYESRDDGRIITRGSSPIKKDTLHLGNEK